MGRVQVEEFLISHNSKKACSIQTIGQKQLLLSKSIIEDCDWDHLRQSIVVPYNDPGSGNAIKGCMLLFMTDFGRGAWMNLCD